MQFLKTLLTENAAGGSVSAGGGDIAGVRMPLGMDRKTKKRFKNIVYRKIVEGAGEPKFDSTEVMSKIRAAERNTKQTKDTVTFGLEDDLGNVVKVLLPKEEAKEFEVALAAALDDSGDEMKSQEIAEILFNLQSKFNIVDVEWPAVEEDEEDEVEAVALNPDDIGAPPEMDGADVGDTESAKSALDKVIDMMRADADARMAEANAKKAEAEAKAAEFAAKAAETKMRAEEEILDMEDFYSRQGEEDKEAKRLAKLAKYRHDLAQQAEDTLGSERISTESIEEMKTVPSKDKKKALKKKMTYQEYLSMARKHVQAQE